MLFEDKRGQAVFPSVLPPRGNSFDFQIATAFFQVLPTIEPHFRLQQNSQLRHDSNARSPNAINAIFQNSDWCLVIASGFHGAGTAD